MSHIPVRIATIKKKKILQKCGEREAPYNPRGCGLVQPSHDKFLTKLSYGPLHEPWV